MPYLRIGFVVVLAAAIMAVGVLGPHPPPQPRSTAQPSASQLAALTSAGSSPALGSGAADPNGVPQFTPDPANLRTSLLTNNVSSQSLAAVGTRLFFITRSNKLESTVIGSGQPPKTIAAPSLCGAISQVAAAGNVLGYVETAPAGTSGSSVACSMPSKVAWTIWLSDLNGGHRHEVASGTRTVDSTLTWMYPVRLALTASTYAFNRPNSPGTAAQGETVAVRSIDNDGLLWTVQTDWYVADLMLGGSRLAVLEREPGLELSLADPTSPVLTHVAVPASSASLSDDGQYLTWDVAADAASNVQAGLVTAVLQTGEMILLTTPSISPKPEPLRPVISSTPIGPIVAWYATVQGGAVYPAFRDYADDQGGLFSTAPAPIWIALRGSTLILVSIDGINSSAVAFAVDLSRSGFKDR